MIKRLLIGLICWLLGAQIAFAAVTLSNTDGISSDTSNVSSITLTSKAFGAAAADRIMVFDATTMGSFAANAITAVTIGGVAATPVAAAYNPTSVNGGHSRMAAWWALVPTGTTGSVAVTFGSTGGAFDEMDWALDRLVGADTTTPISGSAVTATGTAPLGASLTIPASGAGIAMAVTDAGDPLSWTNLTGDVDAPGVNTGSRYSFASSSSAGSSTRTVTSAGGATGAGLYMIAIQQAGGATVTPQRARRGFGN